MEWVGNSKSAPFLTLSFGDVTVNIPKIEEDGTKKAITNYAIPIIFI